MADEEVEPLTGVREAIQALVNAIEDEPHLLDCAVVIWEAVSFAEDGETQRCIRYAVPTDNFSMSAALGLLEAGKHYIRRDALGIGDDDG
jgi:hypothetical protein